MGQATDQEDKREGGFTMKKRWITLTLTAAVMAGLCGCGGNSGTSGAGDTTGAKTETETTTAKAETVAQTA